MLARTNPIRPFTNLLKQFETAIYLAIIRTPGFQAKSSGQEVKRSGRPTLIVGDP